MNFKNESSFEIVILRGVISAFLRPTSDDRTRSTESQKSNIVMAVVFFEDMPWVI